MMRIGEGLGVLNWKTNTIYPVFSNKKEITMEERKNMKNGKYIFKSNTK